jgi:hypothetical protein
MFFIRAVESHGFAFIEDWTSETGTQLLEDGNNRPARSPEQHTHDHQKQAAHEPVFALKSGSG